MAINQANLTPAEQSALFTLLQKAGQGTADIGAAPSTPDVQAQQGVGNVDYSQLQAMLPQEQPQLQQQPGDQMHPEDALKQIASMRASGPQLGMNSRGQYTQRAPTGQPILDVLGVKTNRPLKDSTNYFSTLQSMLGPSAVSILPDRLSRTPEGQPFVSSEVFNDLLKSRIMPSSNNPMIDKERFMGLGLGTKSQADKLYGDDPTKAIPLTELRLRSVHLIASTKLEALRNTVSKQNADLADKFAQQISDAKQSNATPMGQQANRLDNVIHGRQILQGAFDPQTGEYNVPPAMYQELVMNLARAIASTGQLSEQTQKELSSPSIYGNLALAFQKITGQPVTGSTQDILKMYRDQLDRQGAVSEDLFNAHATRAMGGAYGLLQRDPLAYAYVKEKSFGTNNYRQFVQNGPDGASSSLPQPMNLGRTKPVSDNPNQPMSQPPSPVKTPGTSKAEDLIAGYLMKVKAKDTPANRAWAKGKLGLK